jgi:septal ring factor EnvC (AmiA/AmiB activator)
MAGQKISEENFTTETELSSGRLSQSLYIEVRYNDKPQDPSDWFEIDKE